MYEIAYTINELNGKKVIVVLAGTSENFYEQLKRYKKIAHLNIGELFFVSYSASDSIKLSRTRVVFTLNLVKKLT